MPVDLPTREDFFQIGAAEVFARGSVRTKATRVSPEAVFAQGTDINIIIAACSAMADEATRHLALRMSALFLDAAEGEDLDRLVGDRFSPTVVRKQAAPAQVPVLFSRSIPPALPASQSIPIGTKIRTEEGTEFLTTQVATFPVNAVVAPTVIAQAVQAGSIGNVAVGTIIQIVQPIDGVQVTNPEVATGGTDVETDESLRERARSFFITARRGTLGAIEFGALTVPGVASATAIELLDSEGLPNGIVQVFIADINGQSNTVLAAAVVAALLEFRAAGIVADVVSTTPLFQTIAYELGFRAGTDLVAAREQLKQLTVSTVNVLAPQETLLVSLLFCLARSIPGAIVPDTAVVTPTGDVTPAFGKVIKTSLDRVTVNGV